MGVGGRMECPVTSSQVCEQESPFPTSLGAGEAFSLSLLVFPPAHDTRTWQVLCKHEWNL